MQLIGKTLWWTFMSTIPDVVGFGPEESLPRMFPSGLEDVNQDDGIIVTILKHFVENVKEMAVISGWSEKFGL